MPLLGKDFIPKVFTIIASLLDMVGLERAQPFLLT